jgi:HipA-like protein
MRSAEVYRNKQVVGVLSKLDDNTYTFRYHDAWYHNSDLPPLSLTMPKLKQVYTSEQLFPFFFNMLSEGVNRKLQSRHLKIDEKDHFSLLLATASSDTIGAISIVPINEA